MPETTSLPDKSECICAKRSVPELVAHWQARTTKKLTEGALAGSAPNIPELSRAVKMIQAIGRGEEVAFASENLHLGHHLPECPFGRA